MEKYNKQIEDIKGFVEYLENEGRQEYFLYPYRELTSICRTFLKMCEMLANENYVDAEAIYQTLETLNLSIDIINDNIDSIIEKSIAEVKKEYLDEDDDFLRKK